MRKKSNKITIFLIKSEFSSLKEGEYCDRLLKTNNETSNNNLREISMGKTKLFLKESQGSTPPWLTFLPQLSEEVNAKSISGITFKKVKDKIFAIVFGHGRNLLKDDVYEERFGLYITLNILDLDSIKKIQRRDFSGTPKTSSTTLTKASSIRDFSINYLMNILDSVEANVEEKYQNKKYFASNKISGSDSFTVSVQQKFEEIDDNLNYYYSLFKKKNYKENFKWVDFIKKVNKKKETELNAELLDRIKDYEKSQEDIWVAPLPEISWVNVSGFQYKNKKSEIKDDVDMDMFLEGEKNLAKLTIKDLKRKNLFVFDRNGNEIAKWSVYKCINAEIHQGEKDFILSEGVWFSVQKNYSKELEQKLQSVEEEESINFIDYEYEKKNNGYMIRDEKDYNKKLSKKIDALNMDRELIVYGGGHSTIEGCDILTEDKKLLHVKIYGASSTFSHIFLQGLASGEAIAKDKTARQQFNKKIKNHAYQFPDDFKSKDYTVVFVIISKDDSEKLKLPFLSRLAFIKAYEDLSLYYKVKYKKVKAIPKPR